MKQWRVYKILRNGKQICASRSYSRESVESMAVILSLMHIPDVAAVEMRSPDGKVWRKAGYPEASPEEINAAEARIKALPPDELERRKNEVVATLFGFFTSSEPPEVASL